MDSNRLQRIMLAHGLEPITDSSSYDWSTGKFGFGYGVQLHGRRSWSSSEETHYLYFDDIKIFEAMTEMEVIAAIDKARQELVLKIHFHRCFRRFCTLSPQEQAKAYRSFLEWGDSVL